MLRFCKLCSNVVDESTISLRRFSSERQRKLIEQYVNDDKKKQKRQRASEDSAEETSKKEKYYIIKCKNPKFDFYQGQLYPKFQPIPLASRGWHHRKAKGDYFTIHPFNGQIQEEDMTDKNVTFHNLKLDSGILKNLEDRNIINPTPIQVLGIPKILSGDNVALTAETGCGKTYAFLIPLIQQILCWKELTPDRGINSPLGIILTPSKELTLQIAHLAKKLTKDLGINIVKFVGGRTKKILFNPPITDVDIIVSTTGILNKLISNKIYKTDYVRHVILDEADTLFDESFSKHVCHILYNIPFGANRDESNDFPQTAQLTLNSATIPQNLDELLKNVVNPSSIQPVTTGYEHQILIPQKFLRLGGSEKPMMLLKLVKPKVKSKIPVIVFSNSTEACDFTSIFLKQFGVESIRLHKNMHFEERKGKLLEFQNGHCHVLTCTDAGARGLDTCLAKDVINFDFPLITSEYIHRCGRVGRIGSPKDCRIYNFISKPLEIVLTSKIEFAARRMKPIPMVDLIHNKYKEDGQFLHSSDVHTMEWDKDSGSDVEDNEDFEEKYSIPQ